MKKNLLTFGVPGEGFLEFLRIHYPSGKWVIWCAESRPHETMVSGRLQTFVSAGYETVVIADNMIGFCMAQKKVHDVFVFYQRLTGEDASCQGGSLLVAVLAEELGITCSLYPTDFDSEKEVNEDSLCFAGETITPRGSKWYIPRVDRVALGYFKEKW